MTGRANGGTVVEELMPAVNCFLQPWLYDLDMNLSVPGLLWAMLGITTVMLRLVRPDLEQLERLRREVVPLLE